MAVAAILNCFVTPDHSRNPFPVLNLPFKFCVDRVYTFRDIAIWKFHKFGLKCIFRSPKSCFWGVLTFKLFFFIETPKRHFFAQKHAFWALIGRDRSYGVIWTRREEYKKEPKVSQNSPFSQTLFPSTHINQILHARLYPGYLSWFQVSLRSVEKCRSSGRSNFWLSHWLGTRHIAYTTACCHRTIRDN